MEIDSAILQQVLDEIESHGFYDNDRYLTSRIGDCERRIAKLESDGVELEKRLDEVKTSWDTLKNQSAAIQSYSAELKKIKEELGSEDEFVRKFMEENANDLEMFSEKCIVEHALELAEKAMNGSGGIDCEELIEECETAGFMNLKKIFKNMNEEAGSSQKMELYMELEKEMQQFSVTNHKGLMSIFIDEAGPGAEKLNEFKRQFDIVRESDPDNWCDHVLKISEKVFGSRILYHCQHSSVVSAVSFVSLVIGMLRTTIQSSFLILSYAEKLNQKFSFYDELALKLMNIAINELLSRNDGSLDFYRLVFEQSCSMDMWIESVAFCKLPKMADRMFDEIGEEWMKVESECVKTCCYSGLSSDREFGLSLSRALASLCESVPSSLSKQKRDIFIMSCLIPSERLLKNQISSFANRENTTKEQISWSINALTLLSVQLLEMYEMYDGNYADLLSDSKKVSQLRTDLCKKLAMSLYNIFERAGTNYLLSEALPWRNGSPTPSLASALAAVSGPLNLVKSIVDATVFVNEIMPVFGKEVDRKVYLMLLKRLSWSQKSAVEQFDLDLQEMISVFGAGELRYLRSARIILTQKEERNFNYEIPEDDVEYFIMSRCSY